MLYLGNKPRQGAEILAAVVMHRPRITLKIYKILGAIAYFILAKQLGSSYKALLSMFILIHKKGR